jgi:KaiC/GvpD/RAD55 family RecA-like ATPase
MAETAEAVDRVKRVHSGVQGFDEILNGGIPTEDIILVTGTPGSGKTTLCMQMLDYGAKNGENGVYFTLEESAKDIIEQFKNFDPQIEDLIKSGMLKIVEITLTDYESFKGMITAEMEAAKAKRVVIDSVTYFQMFFADIMSIRKSIIEVSQLIKSHNCFGLLIGEIPYGENKLSAFGVEEFAVDGVVALYLMEKAGSFIRAIRVVKMRDTNHLTKFCPMEISNKGIVIYPNAEVFT